VKNYETKVDKSRGKKVMLRLKDYVAAFVHAYRDQVDRLQEKEKEFFGEHVDEQTLSEPCQVEVLEFYNPYRFVWLFFFDGSRGDLDVSCYREDWRNIDNIIEKLRTKYSELKLSRFGMRRMLVRRVGWESKPAPKKSQKSFTASTEVKPWMNILRPKSWLRLSAN